MWVVSPSLGDSKHSEIELAHTVKSNLGRTGERPIIEASAILLLNNWNIRSMNISNSFSQTACPYKVSGTMNSSLSRALLLQHKQWPGRHRSECTKTCSLKYLGESVVVLHPTYFPTRCTKIYFSCPLLRYVWYVFTAPSKTITQHPLLFNSYSCSS